MDPDLLQHELAGGGRNHHLRIHNMPLHDHPHQDRQLVETATEEHTTSKDSSFFPHHSFENAAEESTFYTYNIVGALCCVAMVALISGLFLGLLTLDALDLQIIMRASLDEDERQYAATLLPLVRKRHQILVTLLLMNALAYEALPLFLDNLVSTWAAILLSVTFVMFFGEILPSGIFMGPNQLYLGYRMSPIMIFLLYLFYPIAMPLAKLLDYLTDTDHAEGTSEGYNRSELSALIRIQHEAEGDHPREHRLNRVMKSHRSKDQTWANLKAEIMERVAEYNEDAPDNNDKNSDDEYIVAKQLMPELHRREVDMVEGALSMKTVHAMDVYTPFSGVYAVPDDLILDRNNVTTIYGHGYSRVPVYRADPSDPDERSKVLGFLITRQLMLIDWDDLRPMSTLPLCRPTCVSPRINLINLFEILQKDGPMLTFVCARPDLANKALQAEQPIPVEAGFLGIITLVDIMESIIQDRIYDEGDIRDRDRAVATLTRWAASKLTSFIRKTAQKKKLERQSSIGQSVGSSRTAAGNSQRENTGGGTSSPMESSSSLLSADAVRHQGFFDPPPRDETTPLLQAAASSSTSQNGVAPSSGDSKGGPYSTH